jgi:hypothetical protein
MLLNAAVQELITIDRNHFNLLEAYIWQHITHLFIIVKPKSAAAASQPQAEITSGDAEHNSLTTAR